MMASNEAPDAVGTRSQQEAGRVIRAIGLGAGPAAAPFAAAALQPVLGAALLATELVFVLIVFGIVVYGTQEQVDWVFRLLRWLRSRPEPPAPASLHEDNPPRILAHQPLETVQVTKETRQSANSSARRSGV
jgi:hypothetical protein